MHREVALSNSPGECVVEGLESEATSSNYIMIPLKQVSHNNNHQLSTQLTSHTHSSPMPAREESSFLVNLSPISVISDVKQKNVSASA